MSDPFAGELPGLANSQTPKQLEQDPFAAEITPHADKDYDSVASGLFKSFLNSASQMLTIGPLKVAGSLQKHLGLGSQLSDMAAQLDKATTPNYDPNEKGQYVNKALIQGSRFPELEGNPNDSVQINPAQQKEGLSQLAGFAGGMSAGQVGFSAMGSAIDEIAGAVPTTVSGRAIAAIGKIAENVTSGARKIGLSQNVASALGETAGALPKQLATGAALDLATNPDHNTQEMLQTGALAVMNSAMESTGNINLKKYVYPETQISNIGLPNLTVAEALEGLRGNFPNFDQLPLGERRRLVSRELLSSVNPSKAEPVIVPPPAGQDVDTTLPDYIERIASKVGEPSDFPRAGITGYTDILSRVLDRTIKLGEFEKAAGTTQEHIRDLSLLTNGSPGRIDQFFKSPFLIDWDGLTSGDPKAIQQLGIKGFKDLVDPIETDDDDKLFKAYLVGKRMQDLAMNNTSVQYAINPNTRERVKVTGTVRGYIVEYPEFLKETSPKFAAPTRKSAGIKQFTDFDAVKANLADNGFDPSKLTNPKTIKPPYIGIDPVDAYRTVDHVEKNHPDIAQAGQDLTTVNQAVRSYQMQSSMLSPRAQEIWDLMNESGIPIERAIDSKGEAKILNPFEASKQNAKSAIYASDRNVVRNRMFNLIEDHPNEVREWAQKIGVDETPASVWTNVEGLKAAAKDAGIEMPDNVATELAFSLKPPETEDIPGIPNAKIIRALRGGQVIKYQVNAELARAIDAMSPAKMDMLFSILGAPAKALRTGIVENPVFGAYDMIRQSYQATLASKYGFKPSDSIRGFVERLKEGDFYKEWMAAGGGYGTMLDTPNSIHPIALLDKMTRPMLDAAKLGEYIRGRKMGASIMEAALQSRSFIGDFGLRGTDPTIQGLMHATAFMNPGMQSISSELKAAKANPVGWMIKGAATVGMTSLINYMLYHDDKDVEQLRKSPGGMSNWYWKIGNQMLKTPKPFLPGQIFGTSLEAALDQWKGNDPDSFKKFGESFLQSLTFPVIPTAADVGASAFFGKDAHTLKPIVPQSLEGVDPQYQQTANTSNLGKSLASIVKLGSGGKVNISPITMDYITRASFGDLGKLAMSASGQKNTAERYLSDWPYFSRFLARYPTNSTDAINTFYDKANDVDTAIKTAAYLYKTGEVDKYEKYVLDNTNKIALAPSYTEAKAQLSTIRQSIQAIENVDNMEPATKREMIDYLIQQSTNIADGFNKSVAQIH